MEFGVFVGNGELHNLGSLLGNLVRDFAFQFFKINLFEKEDEFAESLDFERMI